MSQSKCPRRLHPCETVLACVAAEEKFSFRSCFPSSDNDQDEYQWQLRVFCIPSLDAVQLSDNHFLALDVHFTKLIPHALTDLPSSCTRRVFGSEAQATTNILCRLPSLPQRLFSLNFSNTGLPYGRGTLWDVIKDGRWASRFVLPEAHHNVTLQVAQPHNAESILSLTSDLQDIVWENLYVTTFMDTDSIVLAAKIALQGFKANLSFAQDALQDINLLADLIEVYENLNDTASLGSAEAFSGSSPPVQKLKSLLFLDVVEGQAQGRAILKVSMWTVWQRSVMLYFYYILRMELLHGYSSDWNQLFAIQGIDRLSDLDSSYYRADGIPYMCNWAFEVLRTSRSSLCPDFRTLLSMFDLHFEGHSGRCFKAANLSCKSDLPGSCERFTGAETKSQSAPGPNCNGPCTSNIAWSEESYKGIVGARAVSLSHTEKSLQYCQASENTIEIPHVWSHGQSMALIFASTSYILPLPRRAAAIYTG